MSAEQDAKLVAPPDAVATPEQDKETRLSSDIDSNAPKGPPAVPGQDERSRGKVAIIMLALGMATFLAAIDITIVTTALPTISEHFHSNAAYTWVGSGYLLGAAASTPIWGKFSDIFGRKPVLLIANIVFFVGSLVAGLASSVGMLITARAIQGIGGGGLLVLVNICIGDLFSPRRRGAYYGMIGGVWAIASSLGPIIGGVFTEKVTWRWCFYINLPLDGVALVLLTLFLDLKTPTTPIIEGFKAIDWLGSLFVIGGTLMLLLGLEFGGDTHPWDSATVICLIVFGAVAMVLFGVIQWKFSKYPIMPLRIFSKRTNMASLAVCFFHGWVFIGGAFYLPLYFQVIRGATPILSGVYVLANSGALSIASIATGIWIRKTGLYIPPIVIGLVVMTLGFGLYINLDRTSSWAKIIIYQIIAGLGCGPNFQAPLISLQSAIAPRDIGTATATFAFTRNLSTAISVVVGQVVFSNYMRGKYTELVQAAGVEVAELLQNGPGAATQVIDRLPAGPRDAVRDIFSSALQKTWILYTAFAAVGIVAGLLVGKQTLSMDHKETETGLKAEEAHRLEMKKEAAERAAARLSLSQTTRTDKDLEQGKP